jgi:hypothetical protein
MAHKGFRTEDALLDEFDTLPGAHGAVVADLEHGLSPSQHGLYCGFFCTAASACATICCAVLS